MPCGTSRCKYLFFDTNFLINSLENIDVNQILMFISKTQGITFESYLHQMGRIAFKLSTTWLEKTKAKKFEILCFSMLN